jgi:type IV pilus assembly protein PilO
MTAIERMRRLFTIALALLAFLDLAMIVYLRWPGTTNAVRHEQEEALKQELARKKAAAGPLHGIDKKLLDDRDQVKNLYKENIPNRWSEISTEVQKLAQENGIVAQNIRYSSKETGLPELQRINVETSVSGDYGKIAHFINALERDKLLFLVTQISLTGQEAGVQLQIKFDTFLKETA